MNLINAHEKYNGMQDSDKILEELINISDILYKINDNIEKMNGEESNKIANAIARGLFDQE